MCKTDKSLPKHDQGKRGGGSLVMTKLNFSLVMTKDPPPSDCKLVMTKLNFSLVIGGGHDQTEVDRGGVSCHDQTQLQFGHDERPPPPPSDCKLVMTKLNFSLVMTKDPPSGDIC